MNKFKDKYLLSVIIPVFNTADYLSECLDSIINQTYRNLEIIIVNDGSTDNSLNIIRDYEKNDIRIKVVNKSNEGLSSARNAALNIMTGDLVTFVDSDDKLNIDTYNENILYFEQDNSLDMLQFPILFRWTGKAEYLMSPRYSIIEGSEKIFSAAWENKLLTYSSCHKIFSKNIFKKIRYPEGAMMEDMYIISSICRLTQKVLISKKGCYFYRYRDGSILHSESFKKQKNLIFAKLELYKNSNDNPNIKEEERLMFLLENVYWFMVHYFREYSAQEKAIILNAVRPYPIKLKSVIKILPGSEIRGRDKFRLLALSLFGLQNTYKIFRKIEQYKSQK